MNIEFKKTSEFPRGTILALLRDGYAFDKRYERDQLDNWKATDDFFYDNPQIADTYSFVTCLDGNPIGFTSWDPRNLPAYVEIGHNCIRMEYKGRKYGKMQLQETIKRIKCENPKVIKVTTDEALIAAQKNYESVGFQLMQKRENTRNPEYAGKLMDYEMRKKVSELTPEEFQKTFPIILEEHNPAYKEWYETEKNNILRVVNKDDVVRINHIGSSAIEGLLAKPIVDILLEINGCCNVTKLQNDLKTIGFGVEIANRAEDPFRLLLSKGMTCDGFSEKVYLLHVRYVGNWSELYFRDYLIAHPEVAVAYGELKAKILTDIENGIIDRMPNGNPNGYSQAKFSFVKQISDRAKEEFQDRYRPNFVC